MKYTKQIKIFITAAWFIFVFSFSLQAQWNIPEDIVNKKISGDATYETVKAGKELYNINCKSCHGTPGEGNNIAAIKATDLGTLDFQNQNTAGIILYKITEGMGAMPSFKEKLNEEEKINIVHFVKSFDQNFVIKGDKIQSYTGSISIEKNDETKEISALISVVDKDNKEITSEGAVVSFFVKRIFGDLPIGDAEVTNPDGKVNFKFPDEIPGDNKGNLVLIAKFKDPDVYGNASQTEELNWGEPVHYEDPTLERTLWGFGHRVPLWLLFTYIFIAGTVWAGILYVIFNLLKLKKAGK